MSKQIDFLKRCIALNLQSGGLLDLLDRIEELERERDAFYMDYRMKCDEEVKGSALVIIERDQLRAELAAAMSEIERKMSAGQFVLEHLAAEQANNMRLRERLDYIRHLPIDQHYRINALAYELIAEPSDTSALEAIVKKAGEVMREKCADASIDLYSERSTFEAIHALPAVTLDDLKGRA